MPGRAARPLRDLSLTCSRRLILAAIRSGQASYRALTGKIAGYRTVTDGNRHRARKSKSPSTFGHFGPKDTVSRIAPPSSLWQIPMLVPLVLPIRPLLLLGRPRSSA
jgi:hypothetical protein